MISIKSAGLGTQLRRLLELLDGDLDAVYDADGFGYRARYTPLMRALAGGDRLTIKELAARSGTSHSAASQTAARMVAEGFLDASKGEDARERKLGLTQRGRKLLPLLQVRWAATERAARSLEAEIGLPLAETIVSAIQALEKRGFRDRIISESDPSPS
jgi:DNA-binding MarR family transcriptional regulator